MRSQKTGFLWKKIFPTLAFLFLIATIPKVHASHFRFGSISWQEVGTNQVEITVKQAWRLSFWPGLGIGSQVNTGSLDLGDGNFVNINLTITSINASEDWFYGEFTYTHTYASSGDYTVNFSGCCRLSSLENNADGSYYVESLVNVGTGNNSPVSTLPSIINTQEGQNPASFTIPATDPDGDVLSYRLANPAETNNAASNLPPNFAIDSVSGLVTFNTVGLAIGSLYNGIIAIEDGQTKVLQDFIIEIVQQSTPPVFDYGTTPANGTVFTTGPGQTITFTVVASDPDNGDQAQLFANGLPSGSGMTPNLPTSGNPVSSSFSWTPGSGDLGSYVINFFAEDNQGVQTSTTVTVVVSLAPVFDVPPSAGDGSIFCVSGGDTVSDTIQASDLELGDLVTLSVGIDPDTPATTPTPPNIPNGFPFKTTLPSNIVYAPTLPTTPANPTFSEYTWNVTDDEWGIYFIEYTATDTLGDQTSITHYYIVNRDPSITSSPVTQAIVGQPYSYTITSSDPDSTYGDLTAFADSSKPYVTIPSWMTLTDNGDGTATLSGTPVLADTGSHAVSIELHDRTTHFLHKHQSWQFQNFNVEVLDCDLQLSATYTDETCASASDGTIDLTVVNGTGGAISSYNWNGGQFATEDVTGLGAGTYQVVVTDENSCVDSLSVVIGVTDTIAPVLTSCPSNIVEENLVGDCSDLVTWEPPTASDNCDGDLTLTTDAEGVSIISQNGLCIGQFPVGTTTVTHTFTDDAGNSISCEFDVTINDTEEPIFTGCPTDITVQAPLGTCEATASWNPPTASDNCPGVISSTSHLPGATFPVGTTLVTYTATDAAGNTQTCTFNVIVEDVEDPVAVCQDMTVYLDASGNVSISPNQVDNGSTDNCSIVSLSLSTSDFTCVDVGANNVTLTATDSSGNTGTCIATITVVDTISPVAIAQDITIYLDVNGEASISANDIDNGSNDACGISSLAVDMEDFTCSEVGGNAVVLTVTDVNGNSSTANATVTVEDTVSPAAVAQDITVYLDASGNASIVATDIDNGSSDACGIASLGIDVSSFTCAEVGGNAVVLTVTDVNGNSSTANATVTVEDTVSPAAVAQDITVYLDASGNASIVAADIDNGSSDACGIASLGIDISSFTCSEVGGNAVVLTVTDVNGNSSTANATVTVEDTVSPVAVAQDITVYLDASGNASIVAADIDNGSSDACGIASLGLDVSSFTCAEVGGNAVVLTVTDVNGNSSTANATVTVEDTVSPAAVAQDITVYLDASGNASIVAADIDNGSSDACGIASLGIDVSSFTCAEVGGNAVVLTVTDVNGNSSTANATVTVEDTVSPAAVAQDITVYLDASGNASIVAADIDNGSSDACGIASLGIDVSSFTCSEVGGNAVVLTVTDVNGNSSTANATVTVEDTVSPVAVAQDITVYLDASGNASIVAADIDNGSSDACGIASLGLDVSSFTCAEVGGNAVVLTVTDVNGNSSTANATVTVEDTVSPAAVAQDITVYLDASGNASIVAADIDNGSSDACGIASLGIDVSSFTCSRGRRECGSPMP